MSLLHHIAISGYFTFNIYITDDFQHVIWVSMAKHSGDDNNYAIMYLTDPDHWIIHFPTRTTCMKNVP